MISLIYNISSKKMGLLE